MVSLAAFVGISATSYLALPDDLDVCWWLAPVLVLVTTPLTVLANAAEFKVMGDFSGRRFGWLESSRLTLAATAANLLPVPGGLVVRTQALRGVGASYRRALGANAVAGGAWLGVGALATGVLLLDTRGWDILAVSATAGGVCALGTVVMILRQVHPRTWRELTSRLLVVEAAIVGIMAARIAVAFSLLGASIDLVQAVALTAPPILAAAIGVFPGGLGLREALSGVVAVIVDLPVAVTVAATSIDRILAQCGLALMATVLLVLGGRAAFAAPNQVPDEGRDPGDRHAPSGGRVEGPEDVPHHGL